MLRGVVVVVSQDFDKEGRWGGAGNVLNFDHKAKKPSWCSSWSHRTPGAVRALS